MRQRFTVGIDLGGTNIKGCVLSADGDAVVARGSIESAAQNGPDHVIDRMVELAESLIAESGAERSAVAGIGIGSPGPLSHRRGVIYQTANLPGWRDVPLRERVAEATGLPAVLDNDANVAAFGEFIAGAARDAGDMVMLTLGTGVGCGVVLDGRVHRGHFENAGEAGHMVMEPLGRECPCGQHGCLERYASAQAVADRFVEAASDEDAASELAKRACAGEAVTSADVSAAARAGDALAMRIWDETCRYLAIACVNIQHLFNPEVVVLGGGLIGAGAQLLDPVRAHHSAMAWKLTDDRPKIEFATLGEAAGSIGAAALARAELPA